MNVLDVLCGFLKRIGKFTVTVPIVRTGYLKPMDEDRAMMFLNRTDFTDESTIGPLLWDGQFQCFILEDTCRENSQGNGKVYGKTAIPAGVYEVQITYSAKFKRDMPILLNVPNFTGVRIHWGNSAKDTDACLLTGHEKSTNWIGRSKEAFDALYAKIETELKKGPLYIAIHGGREMKEEVT